MEKEVKYIAGKQVLGKDGKLLGEIFIVLSKEDKEKNEQRKAKEDFGRVCKTCKVYE